MQNRTVTFAGAYYGKMIAKHWGCHCITAAEINRLMNCFNQQPSKSPNKKYEIIHSKNYKLNNKNTQRNEEPN